MRCMSPTVEVKSATVFAWQSNRRQLDFVGRAKNTFTCQHKDRNVDMAKCVHVQHPVCCSNVLGGHCFGVRYGHSFYFSGLEFCLIPIPNTVCRSASKLGHEGLEPVQPQLPMNFQRQRCRSGRRPFFFYFFLNIY